MKKVKQAAEILKTSGALLVLTGAGVSAESGIPTYRDLADYIKSLLILKTPLFWKISKTIP